MNGFNANKLVFEIPLLSNNQIENVCRQQLAFSSFVHEVYSQQVRSQVQTTFFEYSSIGHLFQH